MECTRQAGHTGPPNSQSHNLLSGRAIGTTFDTTDQLKNQEKVDRMEPDPRVRTRVISDEQLEGMLANGTVPPSVKSSQKKRTDKGGLLGKLGLRPVESTGMPDAYVKAMVATQAAPIMMPVGMLLYGTGSKQEQVRDCVS